jgi:hypothetical protein
MKEYKIIAQKGGLFKNKDEEFETILNNFAREGWAVISSTSNPHTHLLKVILERQKY